MENAIKTLKAVKASNTNLKTNLVLLYSDEITYAGTQNLPADWEKAEKEEQSVTRVESAKTYTRETIAKLKQANVLPDIVTIGNEVNWNFLGITDGEGWEGWKAMGDISALLKKEGVKNAVSIAAQPDAASVKYIVQKLGYASVDYDYIGVNVYPDNNTNSYIKSLKNEVESCAPDKQLIVSNVEYERVNEANTANVYTQADSIYNLLEATIDEKNAGGLIYNEAAYVGSWKSFFDDEGDAQVSMAIFAYAQGNETDTSRDPYKYGDDTGLKQQKVTIKKVKNMSDSTIRGIDISSYTALKKAGVKYYDNEGILPVKRSEENYRLYDETAMARLWEILWYKEMGFELKEIKNILTVTQKEKNNYLNEKIQIIEGKIQDLEKQIKFIRYIEQYGIIPIPINEKEKNITYKENIKKITS